MPDEPARVLFLLSDTAQGHRSVARALSCTLADRRADVIDCKIVDLFVAADLPVLRHAAKIYEFVASRHEWLYNLGFALSNTPGFIAATSRLLFRLWRRKLLRFLTSEAPDLVVVTHPFLVSSLVDLTRRRFGLDFKLVTVVTDLVSPHASWAWPSVDLCLVPTQEARQHLKRMGQPVSRMRDVAFPVEPRFFDLPPMIEARRSLDLKEDEFTILVSGGGAGLGRLVQIVASLERSLPNVQILALAGHNTRVWEELEAVSTSPNTHIYGFTDDLPRLMSAADVVVGKAGPSTIMEARAAGRPIVILDEVGRQEQGNTLFAERSGIGFSCKGLTQVATTVARLIDHQERHVLHDRAATLMTTHRENAALIILDELGLK